jgi:nicotinic acid phosphoribosyltransferase
MPHRLDAHVLDLPVQELRRGYLSDIYFWREKITLEHHNLDPEVTMQVFQKKRPSYAACPLRMNLNAGNLLHWHFYFY